jgi:hypothetical protein
MLQPVCIAADDPFTGAADDCVRGCESRIAGAREESKFTTKNARQKLQKSMFYNVMSTNNSSESDSEFGHQNQALTS